MAMDYMPEDEIFAMLASQLRGNSAYGAYGCMLAAAEYMALALKRLEAALPEENDDFFNARENRSQMEADARLINSLLPQLRPLIEKHRHRQNDICIRCWQDIHSDEEMEKLPYLLERFMEAIKEEWPPEKADREIRRRSIR